jgi:hypothetical protein
MTSPQPDLRSSQRKAQDDLIAAEPHLAPPQLTPGEQPRPVEAHLVQSYRRPLAVLGIVENGLVRPLDPRVKLPDQSRVIIVASESI